MTSARYVVYGAGAVGGVIGALLHRAGFDVTLIARGAHLAAMRARGLRLDAPSGVEVVPVRTAQSAAEVDWTNDTIVLLCVKGHQSAPALDDLYKHASSAAVVSVQNGVANELTILRRFAGTYSICVMLPAVHLEPGVVVQRSINTPGILDVGRYPHGVDAISEVVSADLRRAGFASESRPDIMAWKYRKLIRTLANGVHAIAKPSEAADHLIALARAEGEAAIAAAGIPVISEDDDQARRASHLQLRTDVNSGNSTWQSVHRALGNVEIDYFAGEVVLLGRTHGVPAPVNTLVQSTVHSLVRAGRPAGSLDAVGLLAHLGNSRGV